MKRNIKRTIGILFALFCLAGLGACNEDLGVKTGYIKFSEDYLQFTRLSSEKSVDVSTSASSLTPVVVSGKGWCSASYANGKLTVGVETNETNYDRCAVVKMEGDGVVQSLVIMQDARKMDLAGIGDFDYTAIFTDNTCSELRPGITETTIDAIQNTFFRTLAQDIFNGNYDMEFRVQEYKSWQHPNVMATQNKTSTYSLRDNPTGISVNKDEEIVLFAGDLHGQQISVFIQNPDNKISGTEFNISTGINRIAAPHSGLIYVLYHTAAGTEAPVKINFATGAVNGYFDIARHGREDWAKLLDKASFRHFDLVGKYAHLTFETAKFRRFTPDGLALVEQYDEMVRLEQDFMGLFKYGRAFKNRLYFVVVNEGYMYASSFHTGYQTATQSNILDLDKFTTTSIWGPAHEVGHVNQTRPGLKWHGMTEVTNNIHSLYIQTTFGNKSRLMDGNEYFQATQEIIEGKIAHNQSTDVFHKLVPFWQLKLYLMDAQGKTDFYKDLYEQVRLRPNPATAGEAQIEFVKIACEVAKLDLTEFFEAWGFFTPVNITIDDYGQANFTVTQDMVDNAKSHIAGLGFGKPKHRIENITDENVNTFK